MRTLISGLLASMIVMSCGDKYTEGMEAGDCTDLSLIHI